MIENQHAASVVMRIIVDKAARFSCHNVVKIGGCNVNKKIPAPSSRFVRAGLAGLPYHGCRLRVVG